MFELVSVWLIHTGMYALQLDSGSQPRQPIRITWEAQRYPHITWVIFSSIRVDSQVTWV